MSDDILIRDGRITFMALDAPRKNKFAPEKPAVYSLSVEIVKKGNEDVLTALRAINPNIGSDKGDTVKITASSQFAPLVTDENGNMLEGDGIPRGGVGVTGTANMVVSGYKGTAPGRGGINLQRVAITSYEVDEAARAAASAGSKEDLKRSLGLD